MAPLSLQPPLALSAHHSASLANLRDAFVDDPTVLALLLGGSLAHGFAAPMADIDYIAVVTPDEYRRRADEGHLTRASLDGITYEGGYTDGKFVDVGHLENVARSGSEPARFAFLDARFVIDRDPAIAPLLAQIIEYPECGVDDRIERFAAQLLAWRWYFTQAVDKQSRYLELLSLQKLTLFSCRLVLATNRMLYPYHKWMLRVTESAPHRPPTLIDDLEALMRAPDVASIDHHVRSMVAFAGLDHDALNRRWGGFFLRDNEQTWMSGQSPIDDV